MDTKKQDYVARISSATPLQLVIITYDIILEGIALAKNNVGKANIQDDISQAQQVLLSLASSLNMDIEISKDIFPLYMYVNKLLISCSVKANIKNTEDDIKKLLTDAEKILNILLDGWKNIEDTEKPIMVNSQQLFAGLTYKNGKLSEYIDEDTGRSFKA